MIGIYDKNDTLITPLVETALPRLDMIEIKNKTLDGQWHIQTIGTASKILEVTANVTLSGKQTLDTIKSINDQLNVRFDGGLYSGIIDETISYTRQAFPTGPMFKASFKLLVLSEGVDE